MSRRKMELNAESAGIAELGHAAFCSTMLFRFVSSCLVSALSEECLTQRRQRSPPCR